MGGKSLRAVHYKFMPEGCIQCSLSPPIGERGVSSGYTTLIQEMLITFVCMCACVCRHVFEEAMGVMGAVGVQVRECSVCIVLCVHVCYHEQRKCPEHY